MVDIWDYDDKMSQEEIDKSIDEFIKDKKSSKFDFNFSVILEPYYRTEINKPFLEPFYIFESRLSSLQRYFEYTWRYILEYLSEFKNYNPYDDENEYYQIDAAAFDIRDDMMYEDEIFFSEHHLTGIIVVLFSLVESLLDNLTVMVAEERDMKIILPQKNMPYLNKYLYFLTKDCSLPIEVNKKQWKYINTLREVRNKYIHKLGKNIPDELCKKLNEIFETTGKEDFKLNYEFVELAFQKISEFAKGIELSYWYSKKI